MSPSETDAGIAPVIPIFAEVERPGWRSTWDDEPDASVADSATGADADDSGERDLAERMLMKRLRGRSLSVVEARQIVAEKASDPGDVDAVLTKARRLGYLDDAALAEQLVHSAVERKGQGRRVIAQTLAKRGIPRDVIDAALAQLPDDDRERALEFARSKARSMGSLDRETALRRLSGQLARRGYGGSAALDAAREALDEQAALDD
jgi:regulatory protein